MDGRIVVDNLATIAEAPGGVERIRDLILALAVRGRLVDQIATEQPAAELLAQTAGARRELIEQGEVPRPRALAANPPIAPLFRVPDSWCWARLDDVAIYIQRGKSPRYATGPSLLRVVSQKCVQWSGFNLTAARFVDEQTIGSYGPERFLRAGDLLWNSTGTGTVGRVAIVAPDEDLGPVVADSHVTVLRLGACDPRYVLAWLSGPHVQSIIDDLTTGTTQQQELNTSTVRVQPLPLPPLAEQKRIVSRVDELLGLCAELEERHEYRRRANARLRRSAFHALSHANDRDLSIPWDRASANWEALAGEAGDVEEIRRTVLHLAVQGQLVRQEPGDAPAEKLVEQLAAIRRRPAGPLPDAARPRLPPGWRWTSFGEASLNRDSERVPLKKADRELRAGPYNYYGASGVIDHIDDYLFDGTLLLIGEDGANLVLRSTPIAFVATGRFWVNNHAHVIDSVDESALRYLGLVINSIDLRPHLTGIAQPKLNQARLNAIPVPLPPLAEQRRIVAAVDRLMSLCDTLEGNIQRRVSAHTAFATSVVSAITTAST